MAQTGAEEVLMGCENFTYLVVGYEIICQYYIGVRKTFLSI